MNKIFFLLVFVGAMSYKSLSQERGKPIPCDLTITSLESHDIYNPNETNFSICQIGINKISDLENMDTLILRTITELNVRQDMYLFNGPLPAPGSVQKVDYEIIIAKAAVYYHSESNTEFGINPDHQYFYIARGKKDGIAIRKAGYFLPSKWSRRKSGKWHKFRIKQMGKNCLALIRQS